MKKKSNGMIVSPCIIDNFSGPVSSRMVNEKEFEMFTQFDIIKNGSWLLGWRKAGKKYQLHFIEGYGDMCPCCKEG